MYNLFYIAVGATLFFRQLALAKGQTSLYLQFYPFAALGVVLLPGYGALLFSKLMFANLGGQSSIYDITQEIVTVFIFILYFYLLYRAFAALKKLPDVSEQKSEKEEVKRSVAESDESDPSERK